MDTLTLRDDELRQYQHLHELLTELTEDQLTELQTRIRGRILDLIGEWEYSGDKFGAWNDPVGKVEIALADIVTVERNHRLGTIHYAEADMRGGHYTYVGLGDLDPKKFHAYCLPYDEICWEGPDRDTVDEAVTDAKSHHSDYDPEINHPRGDGS